MHRLDDLAQVLGGGAAAAADDRHPELGDVTTVVVGELLGREVVAGAPVDDARQAGVREHADRKRRVLAQVPQVLLHLGRSGGAVDAEHVGSHRRHGDQGGADLAADEHPAGGLDRDLDLHRDGAAEVVHRAATPEHRRLHLQQVHARLDDEQVDAALEQPVRLFVVRVAQFGEADVAEARQLRAGPDRPGDVAGAAVGGEAVGDLSGDAGRGDVELVGPLADVVLGEHGGEGAEAGRLDGVDPGGEERFVHAGDDVGPGEAEHLVAALEGEPTEVVGTEVERLDVGAEGAVEHDDPLAHRVQVGLLRHRTAEATVGRCPGAGRSTRGRATTAPPGCCSAAGWRRTPSCRRRTGRSTRPRPCSVSPGCTRSASSNGRSCR